MNFCGWTEGILTSPLTVTLDLFETTFPFIIAYMLLMMSVGVKNT